MLLGWDDPHISLCPRQAHCMSRGIPLGVRFFFEVRFLRRLPAEARRAELARNVRATVRPGECCQVLV